MTISSTKAKATRKGRFSFKIRFGDDVEEGTASVSLKARGKTVAKGRFGVTAGTTQDGAPQVDEGRPQAINARPKARHVSFAVRLLDDRRISDSIRLSRNASCSS